MTPSPLPEVNVLTAGMVTWSLKLSYGDIYPHAHVVTQRNTESGINVRSRSTSRFRDASDNSLYPSRLELKPGSPITNSELLSIIISHTCKLTAYYIPKRSYN